MEKQNFIQEIEQYLELEIQVLKSLDLEKINDVMNAVLEAYENEGKIYIFGNGGSAATASHFANDFNKGISEYTDKKFNFVCLNDNVPTLMAIANDIGYDSVFDFQLKNRLKENDLVIGISGSGNSPNVVNAVAYAKEQGIRTIGLTGYSGGKLSEMADVSLNVAINSMQITEDVHMIFDHLIMSIFYKKLAGKDHIR